LFRTNTKTSSKREYTIGTIQTGDNNSLKPTICTKNFKLSIIVEAWKKQFILAAEKENVKIRLTLIEMTLETDLAALRAGHEKRRGDGWYENSRGVICRPEAVAFTVATK
jgi:hypothetical protein